jgi:hypothetical protein
MKGNHEMSDSFVTQWRYNREILWIQDQRVISTPPAWCRLKQLCFAARKTQGYTWEAVYNCALMGYLAANSDNFRVRRF